MVYHPALVLDQRDRAERRFAALELAASPEVAPPAALPVAMVLAD
jgi:hypothetical protein